MQPFWTQDAVRSRTSIFDHIEADDPAAAMAVDTMFVKSVEQLLVHPGMGRQGRVPGTRELVVHPSYVIIYDLSDDRLRILEILHTARRWPPLD